MQQKRLPFLIAGITLFSLLIILIIGFATTPVIANNGGNNNVYAPIIFQPLPTSTPSPTLTPSPTPTVSPTPVWAEFRGMWVTRFDWTSSSAPASPAKIDQIIDDASYAGINAIFFQVRANADAYYTPGLEPWCETEVSGTFGQAPNPAWDPLGYFIQQAQNKGIQLHAYLNIYPGLG